MLLSFNIFCYWENANLIMKIGSLPLLNVFFYNFHFDPDLTETLQGHGREEVL